METQTTINEAIEMYRADNERLRILKAKKNRLLCVMLVGYLLLFLASYFGRHSQFVEQITYVYFAYYVIVCGVAVQVSIVTNAIQRLSSANNDSLRSLTVSLTPSSGELMSHPIFKAGTN